MNEIRETSWIEFIIFLIRFHSSSSTGVTSGWEAATRMNRTVKLVSNRINDISTITRNLLSTTKTTQDILCHQAQSISSCAHQRSQIAHHHTEVEQGGKQLPTAWNPSAKHERHVSQNKTEKSHHLTDTGHHARRLFTKDPTTVNICHTNCKLRNQ